MFQNEFSRAEATSSIFRAGLISESVSFLRYCDLTEEKSIGHADAAAS